MRAFVIRDGAWPVLGDGHAGRTRTIVQALERFASRRDYLWSRNHPYGGVGSVALACRGSYGRTIETPELFAPVRVIDGATLTKLEITFRVATRRQYAPIAMPRFRIMRVPADSRTTPPEPLRSTNDGWASPELVTTGPAWYANGEAQSFTYVPDQNNVIDVSKYHYIFDLVEEAGALTPEDPFDGIRFVEKKVDVVRVIRNTATLDSSVDTDGGTALGGRQLVVDSEDQLADGTDSDDSAKNGIWDSSPTDPWVRSSDLDAQADFTPGWIVVVQAGTANGRSCWQCEHPSSVSHVTLANDADKSSTRPRIVPARPRGNIYHSLAPTFELTDLRWQ